MADEQSLPVDLAAVARQLTDSVHEKLPLIMDGILRNGPVGSSSLRLDCSVSLGSATSQSFPVTSLNIGTLIASKTSSNTLPQDEDSTTVDLPANAHNDIVAVTHNRNVVHNVRPGPVECDMEHATEAGQSRPAKRRRATGGLHVGASVVSSPEPSSGTVARRLDSDKRVFPQRRKRATENPVMQPSTLEKYIGGVWESLFSGVKLDPTEVIEQWQSIQGNGQPKLLSDTDQEISIRDDTSVQAVFGRMNVLTRKISQTSRTCRSLEVIVQAYWVQCFEDRVGELSATNTKDRAKKAAVAEACVDFNWSEKELRNKMAIWRGYHDIQNAGGWAALVFAGMGLYRFCKYRVSFTDETFQTLRALRPRFEVAADTLHPRWRQLVSIVGVASERKYSGHPHDWVVCGPSHEPIPLARTYLQWDTDFQYTHLDGSVVDEEAWGIYDPRTICSPTAQAAFTCSACGEHQSGDPRHNRCNCFPLLYGSAKVAAPPVQVYRTPNGRNNGLIACLAFERGSAIGEFVGQITSGLANMDVMVGETDKAAYQIWQGRKGNYTRFVNHSCQPNSQFERFIWLGTQRIVLVSKGVEAGEEITVDYSDTYWKNLDKECLCGQPKCRYRSRTRILTPPDSC